MSTATDMMVDFEADKLGMFADNGAAITQNNEKAGFDPKMSQDGLVQKVEFADAGLMQDMDLIQQNPPQPDDALGLSATCETVSKEITGIQSALQGQGMAPAMQQQLQISPPQPTPFSL